MHRPRHGVRRKVSKRMQGTVTRVLECPNCGASLAPARFARTIVCVYCQCSVQVDPTAVSAARFRQSLAAWNSPETHGYTSIHSIGKSHWAMRGLVAHGEISDVYVAERARWPTERVVLKLLRNPDGAPLFDREWKVLERLQRSDARGADEFTTLVPQPVVRGASSADPMIRHTRWHSGGRAESATPSRPCAVPTHKASTRTSRYGCGAGYSRYSVFFTDPASRMVRSSLRTSLLKTENTASGWSATAPPARNRGYRWQPCAADSMNSIRTDGFPRRRT